MLGQFISAGEVRNLAKQAERARNPWLLFEPKKLAAHYNRLPFLLNHRLPDHPAFRFEPLADLCRRMPPGHVGHRIGRIPIDSNFDQSVEQYRGELTLDQALDQLEALGAYVVVNNPEHDPVYRPIIEGLLGEI